MVLVGCSPEQKCFDAQMKVWDTTEIYTWNSPTNLYKEINGKTYWLMDRGKKTDKEGKAHYEADAWARCMKR